MDKIKEFYELADSYCRFVSASQMTFDDVPTLMKLLIKLYLSAIDLPEKEPETIDPAVSDETGAIRVTLEERIPRFYWEVPDPFVREDSACGDIVDDLSDIANDLQKGMREYKAGRAGNAASEWKLGFDSHWGKHAVDALRALHAVRTQ